MEQFFSLNNFFEKELDQLKISDEARAYIVNIFVNFKHTDNDLSNQSLTIAYSMAKSENNFHYFQKIGDYLFFAHSLYPESLNGASKDYYCSLAQMSYFNCFKVIKWKLYEEISDQFIDLSNKTRKIIRKF